MTTEKATNDTREEIRDRFWEVTKIDLYNLTYGEIANLLELLPLVQSYLFQEYDMARVFASDEENEA